jgi:hypothetical protein
MVAALPNTDMGRPSNFFLTAFWAGLAAPTGCIPLRRSSSRGHRSPRRCGRRWRVSELLNVPPPTLNP